MEQNERRNESGTKTEEKVLAAEELRAEILRNPMDPAPVARLGFEALMQGAPGQAERCFRDALCLDSTCCAGLAGLEILAYVKHGRVKDGGKHLARAARARELPPSVRSVARQLAAAAPSQATEALPEICARGFLRSVDAEGRLRLVRGEVLPPLVGREELVEDLLRITAGTEPRSVVLATGQDQDVDLLWSAVLPAFGQRHFRRGGGIWETRGSVAELAARIGFHTLERQLRQARLNGQLLLCRDLPVLAEGLSVDRTRAILETGAVVAMTPASSLDQLKYSAPRLRSSLRILVVDDICQDDAEVALHEQRPHLAAWIGAGLSEDALHHAVDLARRFVVPKGLPEAALRLLGEVRHRRSATDGPRRLGLRTLRRVAAEMAGLPARSAEAAAALRPDQLGRDLYRRMGRQQQACQVVGCAVAGACALDSTSRPSPGQPECSLLLVGPTGAGKQDLARAVARELYDEAALLEVDLSRCSRPEELFGGPDGPLGEGLIRGFLRRQRFAVILLSRADRTSPELLGAISAVAEQGRIGDAEHGLSLERSLLMFSVEGKKAPGFRSPSTPPRPRRASMGRLFSDAPFLERTVTVVPMDDEEVSR